MKIKSAQKQMIKAFAETLPRSIVEFNVRDFVTVDVLVRRWWSRNSKRWY